MHLIIFSEIKNIKLFFVVVILRFFFRNFENFVIKFNHEKALNQMN